MKGAFLAMTLIQDKRLLFGAAAAYVLLFLAFLDKDIFWYMYTAATLFFISIAIVSEPIDDQQKTSRFVRYGVVSGLLLYGVFWAGFQAIQWLVPSAATIASSLYRLFEPQFFWHYIVLVLIIIPGEELFFRGFIQKRLSHHMNEWAAMAVAAAFYASVFVFSGEPLWMLAALVGGLCWGSLYIWRKSIPLLIISHLVFDLLFVIFLPLA